MQDGFGHENPGGGQTNDWITPRWVIDAFNLNYQDEGGFFDLDPCASTAQPWPIAKKSYTIKDNGLAQDWFGMVYCNPPYGKNVRVWAERMAKHANGIMLIFARVETSVWQDVIFPTADGFLFPKRRINFARPDGTTPKSSAGAPSAFVAWGGAARRALISVNTMGLIYGAAFQNACMGGENAGALHRGDAQNGRGASATTNCRARSTEEWSK